MSRAVYIGGFGNGRASVEGVAEALANHFGDVEGFTFSEAMRSPEVVKGAVYNMPTFTHSAGMLAVVGASPESITAFNPPIPTTKTRLIGRTLIKSAHMHMLGRGILDKEDFAAVAKYDASALAEIALHPKANLGNLGSIAKFNAFEAATSAVHSYVPSNLVYTYNDDYYRPSIPHKNTAWREKIGLFNLPGEHDELVLRPAQTLQRYFESKQLLYGKQ